jgi:D-alanyl-lipoteichoic acid acyltransferase DltB (MBOAT superfamily)
VLFNSLAFAAFLAVVLPTYHALPRRAQNVFLLVASYVFYGFWDWRFLSLLWLSTAIDFWASRAIAATTDRRRRNFALGVSLATNLGILGFFKYFNFFVDTFLATLEALNVSMNTSLLQIVLPVGISFYTFQTLAYTIDTWRGRQTPTDDPIAFGLYVSFFPQLVAGPIERAKHLLPQLERDRVLTPHFLRTGVTLLLIGLFKKIGLADGVAPYVDEIFADPGAFSSSSIVSAGCLFSIQVYCDFSGYSDIARGTARLLGIDLMINFRQPFLAQNVADLWRRWHISLSSWFADYFYIPLGGSQRGEVRNAFNLLAMFGVSGLWHGAGWNFVLWGLINGVALLVYRYWSRLPRNQGVVVELFSSRWFAGNALSMAVFSLSLVVFRGDGLAGVWTICMALMRNPWWVGIEHTYVAALVVYTVPMIALDLWQWRTGEEEPMLRSARLTQGVLLGSAMIWVLVMGGVDLDVPFIYFQF